MVHPVRPGTPFSLPQNSPAPHADAIRDTIVRGVANGLLGLNIGKNRQRRLQTFAFNQAIMTADIEFSEEMFSSPERQPKLT